MDLTGKQFKTEDIFDWSIVLLGCNTLLVRLTLATMTSKLKTDKLQRSH